MSTPSIKNNGTLLGSELDSLPLPEASELLVAMVPHVVTGIVEDVEGGRRIQ
jgi:hypothetical protein